MVDSVSLSKKPDFIDFIDIIPYNDYTVQSDAVVILETLKYRHILVTGGPKLVSEN
jgi:hypothetical protein